MRSARPCLVLAAVLASACVSGSVPARELWRLDPPAAHAAATMPLTVGAREPLEVATYETPGLYGDPGIPFRVGEARYGTYRAREWAMPLGEMLAARTTTLLSAQRFAAPVLERDPRSPSRSGWRWEGTVREFDEVDRARAVSVAVALDLVVRRAENDSVVWRGTRQLERPVPSPTMANVVAALSATADSVIIGLARDAAPALRGGVAAIPSRH
jgi:uncharacterized lipoprotein YmbA